MLHCPKKTKHVVNFICAVGVLLLCGAFVFIVGTINANESVDFVQQIAAPEDAQTSRMARDELWRVASEDELSALIHHDHPNVSLRAAWHRVVTRGIVTDEERGRYAVDEREANRFVEVVEEKIEFSPPDWWIHSLNSYQWTTSERGWIRRQHIPAYQQTDYRFGIQQDFALEPVEGGFFVIGQENRQFIPESMVSVSAQGRPIDGLTVSWTDDAALVAAISLNASRYPINCVDTDGNVIWSEVVWAAGGLYDYSGIGRHYIEFRASDDLVFVFGSATDCIYIESFDVGTGEPRFRFSTSY